MNLLKFNRNKKNQKTLPRYVKMNPRVDNSKVLAQAKKRRFKNRFEGVGIFEKLRGLKIVRIIFIVLLIAGVIGIVIFLRTTTLFDIKEINIIVDKQENYPIVDRILEEYKSRNIVLVSGAEIEHKIRQEIPSINTVFINKSLNGILNIEVIEDSPIYYLVNSSGIYLINQDGEIMEFIEPQIKLELSETEILIKDSKLPADSDQVRLKYLEKIEDEVERAKIIWKDVSKADKETVLAQMKDDLNNKFNDFNNKLAEQAQSDRFRDLIGSYILGDTQYSVGDQIPLANLNFVSLVQDFFKSKNIIVKKFTWISIYTLEAQLEGNPTILLSVKRDYSSQFEDLNTLIFYGQFNGARLVDVRSSNYSVTR